MYNKVLFILLHTFVHTQLCVWVYACVCVCVCVLVLVAQSSLTLCKPMDCSPPGSSVYGISQARIMEWVAIPFSGGSSRPRDQNQVSFIAARELHHFTHQGKPCMCA